MSTSEAKKDIKWEKGNEAQEAALSSYDPAKSDESVNAIVAALENAETNVTRRMVIGKLVNRGDYVAPEKKPTGPKDTSKSKGERLTAIEEAGFNVSGFDGATKNAIARLAQLVDASDDFGPVATEFREEVEQ